MIPAFDEAAISLRNFKRLSGCFVRGPYVT